jgi:hypothetical protein
MGPQIASFAASLGIQTRLVAGQGHESAAALWAACGNLSDEAGARPGLVVDTDLDEARPAELTVVLAVVDRQSPVLKEAAADVTLLAVSSGAGTAEDLARCAVAADDAGSRIDSIVVADPDALDRTTGRVSQQERMQRPVLPVRLTGPTAAEGGARNVSRLRRRQQP